MYRKTSVIEAYAKMWPRAVFDIKIKNALLREPIDLLSAPGVYVLYRDDHPYYVGKASRLIDRIYSHANKPKDKYYNFWNYFSAFIVRNKNHMDEIEGVLIASMPTENSAVHRIKKLHMPVKVARYIRDHRIIRVDK